MFGTPKPPVSDAARQWLEGALERLIALFGEERLRVAPIVSPTREFFPAEWRSPEEGVEVLLQRVCVLFSIERERVELVIEYDEEAPRPMVGMPVSSTGYSGLYAQDAETGRERVVVRLGEHSDPVSVVVVVAHELCHVLLLGDGKIGRDVEDGEPLTDLLCVFLGLGVLCANSVFQYSHYSDARGQGWRMRRQGYLSEAELAYALALWARRRGDLKPTWPRHLSGNARAYFDRSLRFLEWQAKRS